jgi:crossover junction endodeoxyribonuclease RusA
VGGKLHLDKITLPWPHKDLSPNSRKHRLAVAGLRKSARHDAMWACKASKLYFPHMRDVGLHLRITFHPPDKRRRDIDNMLGSIKSQLDGIADVIGVDDSMWGLTLVRGGVVKGGSVVVEVINQPSGPAISGQAAQDAIGIVHK